ncbi:hypothetical protein [Herpetosiphon gulosus]|uniref:TerB family tellurite resistance protein n=1 Tax=Herpetosiphon gulosus TaxID=1973496 RepID=A0ABP9WZJ4_9CHLR
MSEPAESKLQEFQNQLVKKLLELFDVVIADRRSYYQKNPHKIPSRQEVGQLIKAYSYKNAAITAGLNLIPGPWGLLAIVPEIVLIIRNQLSMIYDIAAAYEQDKVMNRELLAGILASSLGVGTLGLITIRGGTVFVKRASLRIFQQIIAILGGKITQRLIKQQISKFLPVVGAISMAVWSKYTTTSIGKKATEILRKKIEFSDEEVTQAEAKADDVVEVVIDIDPTIDSELDQVNPDIDSNAAQPLDLLKIKAVINLMKTGDQITQQDLDYVDSIIHAAAFDTETQYYLNGLLQTSNKIDLDYSLFSNNPNHSLEILQSMIQFVKQRDSIHITQKMYIKQVGKLLEFSDEDVVELLNA